MPSFNIALPDGSEYTIDGVDTADQAYQDLLAQMQGAMSSTPYQASLGDYARQVLQGTTLGFADEMEAAARQLVPGGEDYTQARDRIRAQNEAFEQANPVQAFGLQAGGGLLTGGLGATRAIGGNILARLPAMSRTAELGLAGAGMGAIEGAGRAEELSDVPMGAAGGAALGGVLGAAMRPVEALAERVAYGGKGFAEREARATLAEQGITTPESLTAALAAKGPETLVADIGPGTRISASIVGMAEGGRQAQDVVLARQMRQPGTIENITKDRLGITENFFERKAGLIADQKAQANLDYSRARAIPVDTAGEISEMVKRGINKGTLLEAAKKYETRTRIDPFSGQVIRNDLLPRDANNNIAYSEITDLQFWDDVVKRLRGEMLVAIRSGDDDLVTTTKAIRKQLTDELDKQTSIGDVSLYNTARKNFAKSEALGEMMEEGRRVFDPKREAEELAEMLSKATKDERASYSMGVAQALKKRLMSGAYTSDNAWRLIRSPDFRARVEPAFPDKKTFNAWVSDMESQVEKTQLFNMTMMDRNSLTQPRQSALQKMLGRPSESMEQAAQTLATGTIDPALVVRMMMAKVSPTNLSEGQAGALSNLYFGAPDPSAIFQAGQVPGTLVPGLMGGIVAGQEQF